jgi:hypothetical protein
VELAILSLFGGCFIRSLHDLRYSRGIGGRYGEARWGECRNIHSISKDVIVLDNNVTLVKADAELNAVAGWRRAGGADSNRRSPLNNGRALFEVAGYRSTHSGRHALHYRVG